MEILEEEDSGLFPVKFSHHTYHLGVLQTASSMIKSMRHQGRNRASSQTGTLGPIEGPVEPAFALPSGPRNLSETQGLERDPDQVCHCGKILDSVEPDMDSSGDRRWLINVVRPLSCTFLLKLPHPQEFGSKQRDF